MKKILILTLVLCFSLILSAQTPPPPPNPYVTVTGQLQGANGLPAANDVISLTPTQMFFVVGSGGGGGGGGGTVTSITADIPIVVTPDPITSSGVISESTTCVNQVWMWNGTAWICASLGGGGGPSANDFYIYIPPAAGIYTNGQQLYYSQPTRTITMPSGLVGTNAGAITAPTGDIQVTLKKNGSPIGTINFAAGQIVPTITFSGDVTFTPGGLIDTGDTFEIDAPATADATFAGFWIDIFATRAGGGGGGGSGPTLQTNGTPNGLQSLLNLSQSFPITITDNGTGTDTIGLTNTCNAGQTIEWTGSVWHCTISHSGPPPGGSTNQIQYNAGGGNFGGFTMNQDCTINVVTGAISCTKSNGVSFGTGAFATISDYLPTAGGTVSGPLNLSSLPDGCLGVVSGLVGSSGTPCGTSSLGFASITAGTNTHALLMGSSGSLGYTGTGTIDANSLLHSSLPTLAPGLLQWNGSAWGFFNTSGIGTVTSVTFTGDGTVLSNTPSSAVTTSGTLVATLNTAGAHQVLGNFTGGSAAPTYNSLTTAELPFTYTGSTAKLATSTGSLTNGNCVSIDASGNFVDAGGVCGSGGGGGTVTSVGLAGPTGYTITGSPVITSGTLTFATPITSTGDLIIGNGTNSSTRLGIGASGKVLMSNGTTASWQNTGTVTSVAESFTGGLISVGGSPITTSGTLALTVAGTSGGVPYFSSSSTWASSGALTANLPIIGGGAGNPPTSGTVTGNTTKFATSTGTTTNGDCASWDVNGNVIDSGAGCTGVGTVTSFSSGDLSPLFTTSVATPTSTPALSFTLSNAAPATLWGNSAGSPAPGSYAYTVGSTGSDIPQLSAGLLLASEIPNNAANTTGSAAKWTTARLLAGNSVDGSANVAFANKFIAQGTTDSGLSAAQFLGSLTTGILKNTTSTGVLSIAVAGDFPTLNQNTTGSAAKWTTARLLAGNSVDGSANVPFANKFIVQGTADTGLSGAQFLGALGSGVLLNTTSTGVLSIAPAQGNGSKVQFSTGTATANSVVAYDASGNTVSSAVTVSTPGWNGIASGTNLFSALPACTSGIESTQAGVTDSTTNTWGATITGGGSFHVLAYCDGSNWTVMAK